MTDTLLLTIVLAASAAVIVWSIRYAGRSCGRRGDQQIQWREFRRELDRHETILLKHCADIERRLDRHQRTLKYLARRLS